MTALPTPLFSADEIDAQVRALAASIDRDAPPGASLHLVGVLTGGFIFLADLCRALARPVTIDFVRTSSYGSGTTSTGAGRFLQTPDEVAGRHVLIVEDIVDTGETLHAIREWLLTHRAASVRTVCLLDKPSRRVREVPIEFIGFTIDDVFVVGYGLDLSGRHRALPYIGVVQSS
jgi:hypoxanthine phosphoribosyltransferase